MAKTYAQINRQIETLKRQAEALKKKESTGVIARIREAIVSYGLTAQDLGLSSTESQPAATGSAPQKTATRKSATGKRAAPSRKKPGKRPSTIRFRHPDGHTWTGMGPKPRWLAEGLGAGKTLEDFAVKPAAPAEEPTPA